ncbi:GumC family protein [Sphingomonas lenta]|nr:polysaccharide biosynthesis tyrosine autokinase [Sphingomonas lenta]
MASAQVLDERHDRESGARLIDLRQSFATIRRRRWWILATMLVVLGLTALAYQTAPRQYSASAVLALDRRVEEVVVGEDPKASLVTDSPTVDTAVQVLTSTRLLGEVADAIGLTERIRTGSATPISPEQARRAAIGQIRGGLQVKRTGLSYAITVGYESTDPQLAARVPNAVVERYIRNQQGDRESARNRESDLLRDRIAQLRGQVIQAEAAVARYRAATNLIDVEKDSTIVQQELSALSTQLATAQAEQAAARARLDALGSTAGQSEASNLLRDLRGQQAQLSAQRADLSGRYGPLHPDLARIERQLADVNRSIAAELSRVRSGAQADYQVASGRAGAIRSSLNRAQGGLAAGNAASVQLAELERNADSVRGLYQVLLERYRQSVAGQGTDQSDAYVISQALVPSAPASPKLPLYAGGGLLAAILAAALLVLILELFESGLKSRTDVEAKLGLPVVATVPDLNTVPGVALPRHDPMGPASYLIDYRASVFGEAFRSIRSALRIGHADQEVRTLAVTSALPGEGKTTASMCLARSAALAGQRVALVDCDVRRRASSRTLVGEVEAGLTSVLKGQVALDAALVRDEPSGAYILGQGALQEADYDLLTSPAMQQLVSDLGRRFDLVVLDTAPVLPLAEARAVASMADGVLFVTRWRRTPTQAAQLALDMLGRAGAHVRGVALTLVDLKEQARSGHGDEMTYYNKFKQYYA